MQFHGCQLPLHPKEGAQYVLCTLVVISLNFVKVIFGPKIGPIVQNNWIPSQVLLNLDLFYQHAQGHRKRA